MTYFLIILAVFVIEIRSDWRLEWNDEFDSKELDLDKWEIYEMDAKKCDPQRTGRLNCYTNNTRNIRMINGTVAITAIPEKIKNKEYTSGFIKTRKNLTYGKIEMRAALPLGKMLTAWFKFVPFWARNKDGLIRRNQVIFLYNDPTNIDNIKHSVSLGKQLRDNKIYLTEGDLIEFHIYEIMWNRTHIIWKFDGLETFNWYNKLGSQTFLDGPTILTIYSKVGGKPFLNGVLTPEDVSHWENPSLILDYIRYYQWTDQMIVNNHSDLKNTDSSAIQLSKAILSETRLKRADTDDSSGSNVIIIAVISIICWPLLLIIITLIVWLVKWMKRKKKTDENVPENENYDDFIQNNTYADVSRNVNNYYSMVEPYLQIDCDDKYYSGYIEPELSHYSSYPKISQTTL